MTDELLLRELLQACRLGLRAAYHACDHPPRIVARTARRGCGARRAVAALEAVLPRIAAALQEPAVPPAGAPVKGWNAVMMRFPPAASLNRHSHMVDVCVPPTHLWLYLLR